jgi:hypothetical protein
LSDSSSDKGNNKSGEHVEFEVPSPTLKTKKYVVDSETNTVSITQAINENSTKRNNLHEAFDQNNE